MLKLLRFMRVWLKFLLRVKEWTFCNSGLHIYITGIVSFSTMQPVSAFLFYYMATDGTASVNVSFQVLAKNHLI